MCTSHVFLQKGSRGGPGPVRRSKAKPASGNAGPGNVDETGWHRNRICPEGAKARKSPTRVLAHFPDDDPFFRRPSESHERHGADACGKNGWGTGSDPKALMRYARSRRGNRTSADVAHSRRPRIIAQCQLCARRCAGLRDQAGRTCRATRGQTSRRNNACMAIVRRNVDNPARNC